MSAQPNVRVLPHPVLSVSTQSVPAGPSTPTPPRRPQGARRRGVAPGLYIANPDNSDDDASSPSSQKSPIRQSPITASSSGSGSRGLAIGGTSISPSSRGSALPTIPLPQSSPLPGSSTYPMSAKLPSLPTPIDPSVAISPVPPQPPPQPERHLRRAFTAPTEAPRSPHETRTATGSIIPSSPTRALPPLPPISSASPSGPSPPPLNSSNSSSSAHSLPSIPPSQSDTRPRPFPQHSSGPTDRTMSPEDMLSPAVASESGGSLSMTGNRARSSSLHNQKRVLQVTTDNEQFSVVDITGINTGEGIRDRVFSKMRFRDDDYPTLSLFRTDIGEEPEPNPVSTTTLLNLCQTVGDSKASLKFLIVQTSIPGHSAASVIPPPSSGSETEATPYQSRGMPPIITDMAVPVRPSSQHSKEGSLSSTSEMMDRSEWSELGPESEEWTNAGNSQIQRATRRNVKQRHKGQRIGSSNSSSRSPLTDRSMGTSSPALPTPPNILAPIVIHHQSQSSLSSPSRTWLNTEFDQPISPFAEDNGTLRKGTVTPTADDSTFNATPGPSNPSGLGLDMMDPDMDPESRALIAQLQQDEKQEAEAARLRQLAEDEQFAQREQAAERLLWSQMQEEEYLNRQQTHQQVRDDEIRARQVAAEEEREARRLEAERRRVSAEAEQLERERPHNFAQERRERREHFQSQNRSLRGRGNNPDLSYEGWTLVGTGDDHRTPVAVQPRRPSDSHIELYPSTGTSKHFTNPLFDQPLYQSPPPQFPSEVPTNYPPTQSRRPSGFANIPYSILNHAQDRLQDRFNDSRLQQVMGRSATPSRAQPIRRTTPGLHPYAYTQAQEVEVPLAPSLQAARSMDNLRPYHPPGSTSRLPYPLAPARSALSPSPGVFPDHRNYQSGSFRSNDRVGDGRYPEPTHSAPARVPPLQVAPLGLYEGSVPFPSPRVSASGSGTWTHFPTPSPSLSHNYEQLPGRPQSASYDRSPPFLTSPRTATLPRRPSTYYDHSPPGTADPGYFDPPSSYPAPSRARSGSASALYQGVQITEEPRRASESSMYEQIDTQLPYVRDGRSEDWRDALSVPGQQRDTDTESYDGTVRTIRTTSSDMTVRGGDNDDTTSTERAHRWQNQLDAMRRGEYVAGLTRPPDHDHDYAIDDVDGDEDEATLFITAPTNQSSSSQLLHRTPALRPSPSRPNLYVDTATGVNAPSTRSQRSAATPSDSATDSESDNAKVHRAQSFARPKDQWHFRPEPEQLYDNLQEFFPKIDLDKPIVDAAGLSTPSTPSAESPAKPTATDPIFGRPPIHPSRQPPTPTLPIQEVVEPPKPPPAHPSRTGQFNKIEARKSIRGMVDHVRKRTLQREHKDVAGAVKVENSKLERRRSSSMWGHRVVEVTPSKFNGTMPSSIPESPSADGKPTTLNWVKGELIGKGSYGRVYIALNVTTGDMMAVKQVELPATERDRNDRRQLGMVDALKSEIALLKDLYHPNIVAYLGYEDSPEYLSIFLEYVPGGTIASIYRTPNQARFEEQLVKFFTAQILEGLAYLHAKHIWHRDLKGDNILVDANGICKISDFGISKQTADAYDSFGQATNMKGSIYWMAPEVVRSDSERGYSGKVDIWSLGCVVLEMWSGKRPWGEMEQMATIYELFSKGAAPPLPKDIKLSDTALDFMNGKCLVKDPQARPMARDLLKHPFITEYDPNWTFRDSKIGKAVAKNGLKGKKGLKA